VYCLLLLASCRSKTMSWPPGQGCHPETGSAGASPRLRSPEISVSMLSASEGCQRRAWHDGTTTLHAGTAKDKQHDNRTHGCNTAAITRQQLSIKELTCSWHQGQITSQPTHPTSALPHLQQRHCALVIVLLVKVRQVAGSTDLEHM
jgi:hypothetical protein